MDSKNQFEELSDGLVVRAPAKINLCLLVAGKRPDGFHEIETVMAKIDLYDEVLIQKGQKEGIEVVSSGPYWAPEGKDNLIYRAAELLFDHCKTKKNIKITLTKNIPAGSGLGSASSDAAAALMGLNKFLKLNLTNEILHEMALKLGSDVNFFLAGSLALCTGKGEKIKKIDKIFNFFAVLILPDINVSTAKVYANYKHNHGLYESLSGQLREFVEKNRIDSVSRMCANTLLESCLELYKEIAELKTKVEKQGIEPLCLSGSGSAMYCIVESNETAVKFQQNIEQVTGCKSIIVSNNRW